MHIDDRKEFHDDFAQALAFATRLHAPQLRKGTDIPYISHLIGVASIVLEHGGNRDEAIGALLHDAIEDQADGFPGGPVGLRAGIRNQFGAGVLDIVEGCTDAEPAEKSGHKTLADWRARKQRYIDHLEQASSSTRLVSCADKLHNARAILADLRVAGNALWDRFNGGKEGSLWYYRSLAEAFTRLGPENLAAELTRTVGEIERLASAGK